MECDLEKIDDYVAMLKCQQEECLANNQLSKAQTILNKIEQLKEHQTIYNCIKIIEKNEDELAQLDQANKE